jgi:cell division protein FtsW (lipid II flippase)
MDPVNIIVTLLIFALVGFMVYLIITYIPMPDPFKQVIIVACVILLILYVLFMLTGHTGLTPLRR